MRRADRLFQIVQMLRTDRSVTAQMIAERLDVSSRTVYRDVQDLSLSGIPIISEPGLGYRLMPGFHLPPLMFDEDEITALLLGARMIRAWADYSLGLAAQRVIDKVSTVLPERLQDNLDQEDILVPGSPVNDTVKQRMQAMRRAIRQHLKITMDYARADGQRSSRVIHPLGLFFWGSVWTLVGWCELRDGFRHFRLDRILSMDILSENFEIRPGGGLEDYLLSVQCGDAG